MVSPDDETQAADNHDGPDHEPITKNVLTSMDANEFRDNAKRWQGHDIDLRVSKKPEQVLKQYWTAARVIQLLPQRNDSRHEITGSKQVIQAHHNGTHQQCWESKQC